MYNEPMKYKIEEITKNTDLANILTILLKNLKKDEEIRELEKAILESKPSSIIREINIYIGDYKNEAIDKKTLIENIITTEYENRAH